MASAKENARKSIGGKAPTPRKLRQSLSKSSNSENEESSDDFSCDFKVTSDEIVFKNVTSTHKAQLILKKEGSSGLNDMTELFTTFFSL